MKMLIRLRFQAPPASHWYLSVRVENDHAAVVVKVFFQEWRSKNRAPRPRHTLNVIHDLVATAKAALEINSR